MSHPLSPSPQIWHTLDQSLHQSRAQAAPAAATIPRTAFARISCDAPAVVTLAGVADVAGFVGEVLTDFVATVSSPGVDTVRTFVVAIVVGALSWL